MGRREPIVRNEEGKRLKGSEEERERKRGGECMKLTDGLCSPPPSLSLSVL